MAHPLQHLIGTKLEFESDSTLYDHDIATGTCASTVTHCGVADSSLWMTLEGSDADTPTVRQMDWRSQRQADPDGTDRPRIVTFAVVAAAGPGEVHLSLPVTATIPALVSAIKRACNAKAAAHATRKPYGVDTNLRAFTGRRNLDFCDADTTILDCVELADVQGPTQPGSAPPAVKVTIVNAGTEV